jgi:hypothetical protein
MDEVKSELKRFIAGIRGIEAAEARGPGGGHELTGLHN